MRSVRIPWSTVEEALAKNRTILRNEEVTGLILVKPRHILVYLNDRNPLNKKETEILEEEKEVSPQAKRRSRVKKTPVGVKA